MCICVWECNFHEFDPISLRCWGKKHCEMFSDLKQNERERETIGKTNVALEKPYFLFEENHIITNGTVDVQGLC